MIVRAPKATIGRHSDYMLHSYPHLDQARAQSGLTLNPSSHLARLVASGFANSFGVDILDRRMGDLLSHGHDPKEIAAAFCQGKSADNNWDQAVTELAGLNCFQQRGWLVSPGWPVGHPGSAPFDAELNIHGFRILGDVKTANSAASGVVLGCVESEFENWAKRHGIPPREIEIHLEGPIQFDRLQRLLPNLVQEVRRRLATRRPDQRHPIRLRFLASDPTDPIQKPPFGLIKIRLVPKVRDVNHSMTKPATYLDANGAYRDVGMEFAKGLIEEHATSKGRLATEGGTQVPFVIAYVQTAGRGDLRDRDVAAAMKLAIGPSHWLGVFYVSDHNFSGPLAKFYPHRNATWPGGLPRSL